MEDVFRIATLLDPRFKKAGFSNVKNADLAQIELVNLVEQVLDEEARNELAQESERDAAVGFDDLSEMDETSVFETTPKRGRFDGDDANR